MDYEDKNAKFIAENVGKDNLLLCEGKADVANIVTMHFGHEEAIGTISIERGSYGTYIWVNGRCIAMVDLFHCVERKPDNNGEDLYFQLIMYEREGDDTIAAFKFKKSKVEFVPEDRTEPLWTFDEDISEDSQIHDMPLRIL